MKVDPFGVMNVERGLPGLDVSGTVSGTDFLRSPHFFGTIREHRSGFPGLALLLDTGSSAPDYSP